MAQRVVARDCIDSTIPVFTIARISKLTLDAFFKEANAACIRCEYLEPQATFLTSRDISSIAPRTSTPIPDHFLYTWLSLYYTLDQIIDFAIAELNGSDVSPTNIGHSGRTCLLLSKNEMNEEATEYLQVRLDFASAVVVLKTVETGCGDVGGQLSTRYPGSDGVLSVSLRGEWAATGRRVDDGALMREDV
ncbi:hypothetical protein D6D22_06618 [Aureobasidium pullulans]|uniref:Uncharacterized protein n=1 Tax=Aureobasidium pullulans TaxID=5580 RepID=A0A4S8XLP3_AURPU|nr:hypothetical protein D6D22_06618 [Aureobasidium pullulans]